MAAIDAPFLSFVLEIASARSNAVADSPSLIAEASVSTSRFAYRTVPPFFKRVSWTEFHGFRSNEAEVLRAMNEFLGKLPQT